MLKKFIITAAVILLILSGSGTASACSLCEVQDLVDTAVTSSGFYRLVEGIIAAGLADTLKSDGPFTILAPEDAAFESLPDGLWETLLGDPEQLTQILLFHVIPGQFSSGDLREMSGQDIITLQGNALTVQWSDHELYANEGTFLATDILASNGWIHVIDTVLLPEN